MSDISEKLLDKAIDSILHGSVQTESYQDGSGNTQYRTVRINDLRQDIVRGLVNALSSDPKYIELMKQVFTYEVVEQLKKKMLEKVSFSDLPYRVKEDIERQMKDMKVEVKKYKLIAEVVE
jgi:hypothetical protein